MPKLEYVCPECNGTLLDPSTLEGKSARCPLCNAKIDRWPAPRSKTAPPETPSEQKANPPTAPKSNEKSDLGKPMLRDHIEDDQNEDDALSPHPRASASGSNDQSAFDCRHGGLGSTVLRYPLWWADFHSGAG